MVAASKAKPFADRRARAREIRSTLCDCETPARAWGEDGRALPGAAVGSAAAIARIGTDVSKYIGHRSSHPRALFVAGRGRLSQRKCRNDSKLPSYVRPSPHLQNYWSQMLPKQSSKRRIGIAWQGNPDHQADVFRSIPLEQFQPLAEVPTSNYIVCRAALGSSKWRIWRGVQPLKTFGDSVDKSSGAFMDTAAIMQQLDLVITSDSQSLTWLARWVCRHGSRSTTSRMAVAAGPQRVTLVPVRAPLPPTQDRRLACRLPRHQASVTSSLSRKALAGLPHGTDEDAAPTGAKNP